MNKIANTWRLIPTDAAQNELAEVRAALGFLPQAEAALAGLNRLAELLTVSNSPANTATNLDECDPQVYETGTSVGLFAISKDDANAICAGIAAATSARVDWHYIAGRVHIKALPALASAPVAGAAQPAAYLTLDEEGSPCMLFFDVVEARRYCALGDEPEPLFRHAAPQASADDVRTAALEEAAQLMDQTSRSSGAELIRALKQPQADKDGGHQRAPFDHPVFAFLLGEGPLHGVHFGDRHPNGRGAYWWRKDLRAALFAAQTAQGERDA
ncbi:hypothetical protein [Achromobacter sp.]|uniref:hypothetical protein n=1 Tax=Achromobacter sp. TaxID=134375 RepID=UPI00258BBEE5|nr:hypothetical protein [Achromobacter sp.]